MDDESTLMELPGVGEALAARLAEAGYTTVLAISASDAHELAERAEIKPGVAQKIIAAARKSLCLGFETARAVRERRKSVLKMTTSSASLDALLGGGVQTQAITEAHGAFGSGKSQLAFQLAVNATLPVDEGGLGGSTVFIDTENTFRPERLSQIARERGLGEDEVLDRVHVGRAYNSDHQMLLADEVKGLVGRIGDVRLVVVDSLTSHFRAEYAGRELLPDRQQKLNRHLHLLQSIADAYNIAVFVTNQVMAQPEAFFGPSMKAIGGNIVGHAATYRLMLRKGKGESRVARLIDSPDLPEGEALFCVGTGGVSDEEGSARRAPAKERAEE